jgi:hypothetical protein
MPPHTTRTFCAFYRKRVSIRWHAGWGILRTPDLLPMIKISWSDGLRLSDRQDSVADRSLDSLEERDSTFIWFKWGFLKATWWLRIMAVMQHIGTEQAGALDEIKQCKHLSLLTSSHQTAENRTSEQTKCKICNEPTCVYRRVITCLVKRSS